MVPPARACSGSWPASPCRRSWRPWACRPTCAGWWSCSALIGVPVAVLTAITTWAHGWGSRRRCVVAAVLAALAVLAVPAGLQRPRRRGRPGAWRPPTSAAGARRRCCATSTGPRCTTCSAPPTSSRATRSTSRPGMVSGYRIGFGTPGDLPLAVAVQCSACLPGGVPAPHARQQGQRRSSTLPRVRHRSPRLPRPAHRAARRQRRRRLRQHGRPVGAGLPRPRRPQWLPARRGRARPSCSSSSTPASRRAGRRGRAAGCCPTSPA